MAQTGTLMRIGVMLLTLSTLACAGAHGGEDGSGAGAGKPAAGTGAAGASAAGKGAAGSQSSGRTPIQHRADSMTCDRQRSATPTQQQSVGAFGCMSDAECMMGENGRCTRGSREVWSCSYDECFADADCEGPCVCGRGDYTNNRCLEGNCQTDADCGADGYCSPSFGSCGAYTGVIGYYCHTSKDECVDDADCEGPGGDCRFQPTVGHWRCESSSCVG